MTAQLAYPLLAVLGLTISAYVWEHLLGRDRARSVSSTAPALRGRASVPGWEAIFIGALIGMAVGAKLGYALAEGVWLATAPRGSMLFWLQAFSGKTITGGLLGSYLGVELAKHSIGYGEPTGDTFAVIAPLSLMLGRVGCLFGGCCLGVAMPGAWFTVADTHGVPRWPAVWVELAFNALFFAFAVTHTLRRKHSDKSRLDGQLFHVYLIAYGAFRFAHELVRDTPRVIGGVSGYQVLAVGIVALGVARFAQRAHVRVRA